MSFRERVARFWSRVRAWLRGRHACSMCGYGVLGADLTGEDDEYPERRGWVDRKNGLRGTYWAHQSCVDYADTCT